MRLGPPSRWTVSPSVICRRLRVSTSPFTRTMPSAIKALASPPWATHPASLRTWVRLIGRSPTFSGSGMVMARSADLATDRKELGRDGEAIRDGALDLVVTALILVGPGRVEERIENVAGLRREDGPERGHDLGGDLARGAREDRVATPGGKADHEQGRHQPQQGPFEPAEDHPEVAVERFELH